MYWQSALVVLLSYLVLKEFGLRSIIGLVVLRDVLLFGVTSFVLLSFYANDLEWHPLVERVRASQFEDVTHYSLQAFMVFLGGTLLLRSRFASVRFFPDEPLTGGRSQRALVWFAGVILSGVAVNAILYGLPKQYLYLVDVESARVGRAEIGAVIRENPLLGYLRRLVIEPLLLFLTYKIAFSMMSFSLPKKIVALPLILAAATVLTWEGQKSLILLFLVFFFMAARLSVKNVVSLSLWIGVPVLALLGRILFLHYTVGDAGSNTEAIGLSSEFTIRVIASTFGVYFYDLYAMYFSSADIIYESIPGWGLLSKIFGFDMQIAASRQMMEIIHPGSETGNLFNTYYFGQALAVFGPLGWIYSSVAAVISVYLVYLVSGFLSRTSKAFGARFVVPYCGLFVVQLTGDLSTFLIGKLVLKLLFSLIVISIFWKAILLRININRGPR